MPRPSKQPTAQPPLHPHPNPHSHPLPIAQALPQAQVQTVTATSEPSFPSPSSPSSSLSLTQARAAAAAAAHPPVTPAPTLSKTPTISTTNSTVSTSTSTTTTTPIATTSSSAGTLAPATKRLPVNPRRKKVAPEQRKRVATACNQCNVRRIKCSGDRPCYQCKSASPLRECLYPEPVEKVTIPKTELEELRQKCANLEAKLAGLGHGSTRSLDGSSGAFRSPSPELVPRPSVSASTGTLIGTSDVRPPFSQDHHLPSGLGGGDNPPVLNRLFQPNSTGDTDSFMAMQQDSPSAAEGKLLADSDGTARYMGVTSGATFVDNVRGFIKQVRKGLKIDGDHAFLFPVGQYQTFDSRPLPLPKVEPRDVLDLPPLDEIDHILDRLRVFIQDGSMHGKGRYSSGGIYFWPWGDLSNLSSLPTPSRTSLQQFSDVDLQKYRGLAIYHTAIAFAQLIGLNKRDGTSVERRLGEAFARARKLLGNPLDTTSYTGGDIAVLALMALYLVENNRRDAAYIAITNAMHVSIMRGIHRGQGVDEAGKRTFWTVYIIDRWLSCLMGRPPTIDDDAISLDPPQDHPDLPPSAGLAAHVELSRISNFIVYHSFRQPSSERKRQAIGASPGTSFKYWVEDLDEEEWFKSRVIELIDEHFGRHDPNAQHGDPADSLHAGLDRRGKNPPPLVVLHITQALKKLEDWRDNLPPQLRMMDKGEEPPNLESYAYFEAQSVGYPNDRAACSLHMAYYQLEIITLRPTFLTAVKKFVGSSWMERYNTRSSRRDRYGRGPSRVWTIEDHVAFETGHIGKLFLAARHNLTLGDWMQREWGKLLLVDLHHIFNAAIIILMLRIVFVNERSSDQHRIQFAFRVFKAKASQGSVYAEDCLRVLEELDALVNILRPGLHEIGDEAERDGFDVTMGTSDHSEDSYELPGNVLRAGPSEDTEMMDADHVDMRNERLGRAGPSASMSPSMPKTTFSNEWLATAATKAVAGAEANADAQPGRSSGQAQEQGKRQQTNQSGQGTTRAEKGPAAVFKSLASEDDMILYDNFMPG